ncbi:tyrosine-type recombinase/integrase [Corynebacterium variabile]|uniref:tyrosine-type recombinase/integrase n=1 Tax=Corynebacterium variabile TaxID=1727 RepID=UPI003A95D2BD
MTFLTEGRAQGWLDSEERLIDLGGWSSPAERAKRDARITVSVDQAVKHWIDSAGDLATSSRTRYDSLRRNHIAPYPVAKIPVADLTPADVDDWYKAMRRKNGTKKTTTSGAYALLHTVLQALVRNETLPRNVCTIDGAGTQPESPDKVVPTPAQLTALVERVPRAYRVAVQVAAWCALRPAEWCELRRKDIDRHPQPVDPDGVRPADRVILHIDRQAHLDGSEWHVKLPKGEKTRRVEVPPHIVPLLDEQLQERSQPGDDGLVFLNTEKRQVSPANFGKGFKKWAADICPGATPHSLRHFGAITHQQAGATLKETMALLGHSTPKTALTYQSVAHGRMSALAARMSDLAAPPAPGATTPTPDDTNTENTDHE